MATAIKKEYIEAVGRRKTASARVRISEAAKTSYVVNEKTLESYFGTPALQKTVTEAFGKLAEAIHFKVSAQVYGGGIASQAAAVRHGLSRALTEFDHTFRGPLKSAGFLKRDPRVKERRKFGLKKARKAPQWSKR